MVANSHITFDQNELLILIRDHLLAMGLSNAAVALTSEAGLIEPFESLSNAPFHGKTGSPESGHQIGIGTTQKIDQKDEEEGYERRDMGAGFSSSILTIVYFICLATTILYYDPPPPPTCST